MVSINRNRAEKSKTMKEDFYRHVNKERMTKRDKWMLKFSSKMCKTKLTEMPSDLRSNRKNILQIIEKRTGINKYRTLRISNIQKIANQKFHNYETIHEYL